MSMRGVGLEGKEWELSLGRDNNSKRGNSPGVDGKGDSAWFENLSETGRPQGSWSRNASEALREAYRRYLCLPMFGKLAFFGWTINGKARLPTCG